MQRECPRQLDLFQTLEKIFDRNGRITQCALQRVAIKFTVKREDNATSIGMLHFYVTSFAVNLDETKPLKSSEHFSARKQRKFHKESATTSWLSSATISLGDGSK